jgi:Domain of unknown function (DUF1883)
MQVPFLQFQLNIHRPGAVVEVKLSGVESDVFLLDDSNFRTFESGQPTFQGKGGHYKQSPVRLQAPSAGHWNVAVVPYGGRVEAKVRVLN